MVSFLTSSLFFFSHSTSSFLPSLFPSSCIGKKNQRLNTYLFQSTELPQYSAGAGYRIVELLLGRIASLGEAGDFTTQSGNFTGTSPMYVQDF